MIDKETIQKKKSRPSVRSIAAKLNLSPITVTRALNGSDSVKNSTKKRVRAEVERVGYNYHAYSKNVNKQRKFNVALNMEMNETAFEYDNLLHFMPKLQLQCISKMNSKGLTPHFIDIEHEADKADKALEKCSILILLSSIAPESVERIQSKYPHLIIIGISSDEKNTSFNVSVNEFDMGVFCAKELIASGHIDHVAIFSYFTAFSQRSAGFISEVQKNSMKCKIDFIHFEDSPELPIGEKRRQASIESYLKNTEKLPTAYFAACARWSYSLMGFLQQNGFSVPGDVSIVGCDNIEIAMSPDISGAYFEIRALVNRLIDIVEFILNNPTQAKYFLNSNHYIPIKFKKGSSIADIKNKRLVS